MTPEETLRHFERAWRTRCGTIERPRVDDYLPGADDQQRSELLVELVKLDLWYRIAAGDAPPLVPGYFERYARELASPAQQIELIELEYRWCWDRGASRLGRQEYLLRFPQYEQDLARRLWPRWDCPGCRKEEIQLAAEEATTASCPRCRMVCRVLPSGAEPALPDGYEFRGELGRGGMGVVYEARQAVPKRRVAVKMIRSDGIPNSGQRERFLREADAATALEHTNIVRLYEVGEFNDCPYIVMELVKGGSLADRLGRQPLPPQEAAEYAETLARAVGDAHRLEPPLVHRDLKPANVLIDGNGILKIADFGLAKRLDGDPNHPVEAGDGTAAPSFPGYRTQTGAVLGTPHYMAPEQAAGCPQEVGPAADVYSLGAILYEMLTGVPPFFAEGATPAAILKQVGSEEPPSPRRRNARVPRDLERICLKCLRKEPGERYGTAEELADDLRRFLDREQTWFVYLGFAAASAAASCVLWFFCNMVAEVFGWHFLAGPPFWGGGAASDAAPRSGGTGNEPHGFGVVVWALCLLVPLLLAVRAVQSRVVIDRIDRRIGRDPENRPRRDFLSGQAVWLPAFALLVGLGALVFYDAPLAPGTPGFRGYLESGGGSFFGRELALVAVWSALLSAPGLLLIGAVKRFRPKFRVNGRAELGACAALWAVCVLLPVLVALFLYPKGEQFRGNVAGVGLRLYLFLGLVVVLQLPICAKHFRGGQFTPPRDNRPGGAAALGTTASLETARGG